MAETDVFERRLRAALVRHTDGWPTDFDALGFAREVAAKAPRRHGLRGGSWWPGVAVPQVAWIALLVTALLAALVAGMLLVGSQPDRKRPALLPRVVPAFVCPPGSTPDEPGPVGQARPMWPSALAFDRKAGKLVALVEVYDETRFDGVRPVAIETWTFEVCTNTWTRMHPNREPPPQIRSLVYDVDSGVTIGVHSEDWQDPPVTGNAWTYDLVTNSWTEQGPALTNEPALYDPVSGLVVAGGAADDLSTYDVETDTWTPIRTTSPWQDLGYSEYVYDASVDRVIAYTGGEGVAATMLLDLRTGAWSRSDAETPEFKMGMWAVPSIVYDEAAARTVIAGDFQWGAYDARADRWEVLFDDDPGGTLAKPAVYDPVNRRLLVFGGEMGVSGDVVAFDLVSREWTVLLQASTGQPAP